MNAVSIALHCGPWPAYAAIQFPTSLASLQLNSSMFNECTIYLTAKNLTYNCLCGQNSTAD